ncbi:MAG TPA: hypothetical protein VJZ06_03080 [Mobilitalea sp.]|nr:hypothetical protein [Mobilitalea sp.]
MRNSNSRFRFLIDILIFIFRKFFGYRKLINKKMEGRYSPNKLALAVALGIGLLWFAMLILTPAHGLAGDGSSDTTISRNGLSYIQTSPEDIYNNYFIRTYAINRDYNSASQEIKNSQDVVIKTAIFLDEMMTNNDYFDIRFLALLYGLFYLVGIYRLIKSVLSSMYHFSEAMLVAVLSVFIFGDISYLAYFNSFYPEAIWMICFIFIVGAVSSQHLIKRSYLNFLVIFVSGVILCLSRQQCGIIGIIISIYLLRDMFFYNGNFWRIACISLSFVMSLVGIISIYSMDSDFDLYGKYHSMTRGVLFQATNPETTLIEFGINPSYSSLANTSAYNYYPLVLPNNQLLQEDFLNQFEPFDIAAYYLKTPSSFINMMDLAIKDTMDLRRDFTGNFEQSKGMPKGAKSIMWSAWSFYKQRSMPKTIGYLFLLIVSAYILYIRFNRKTKNGTLRKRKILFYQILFIIAIGGSQAVISIIMSGAAELGQHAFLMGAAMDMTIFMLFAEILLKMSILEQKDGEV